MEKRNIREEFKQYFNVEVYRINSINTLKNFVLFDVDKKYFYFEIDLVRVFDICKDKNYLNLLKFLNMGSPQEEYQIKNGSKDEILSFLVGNQKEYFREFRLKVIPLIVACDTLTFYPVEKRVVENKGLVELNIYCKDYKINKPTKKDFHKLGFKHIDFLLKNIFQEGYQKFIDLLAWKKQNPLELIPSHWIIQDEGGTGKSEILVDFIMSRLFNIEVIMQEDLESTFNGYIKNSEFLVCEEIEGYSNEKKMKVLTGAKYLTINDKYSKTFKIRNYNNIIIFTNDIKGLKLSFEDRRFNVVGGGKRLSPLRSGDWETTLFNSKKENEEFFKNFHKLIDIELYNFEQFLLNKKVDRLEIQIPIDNSKKLEMQKINSTSEYEFIEELYELGLEGFINEYSSYDWTRFLVEEIKNKDNRVYVTSKSIYKMYCEYCKASNLRIISKNHFTRRLKKTKIFNDLFEDIELLSDDNSKIRAYKFKEKNKLVGVEE